MPPYQTSVSTRTVRGSKEKKSLGHHFLYPGGEHVAEQCLGGELAISDSRKARRNGLGTGEGKRPIQKSISI